MVAFVEFKELMRRFTHLVPSSLLSHSHFCSIYSWRCWAEKWRYSHQLFIILMTLNCVTPSPNPVLFGLIISKIYHQSLCGYKKHRHIKSSLVGRNTLVLLTHAMCWKRAAHVIIWYSGLESFYCLEIEQCVMLVSLFKAWHFLALNDNTMFLLFPLTDTVIWYKF